MMLMLFMAASFRPFLLTTTMSPHTASQEPHFLLKILRETVKLLFLKNDEPFLASQSSRKLALEFVFGRLQYTSFDLSSKIRDVHQERKDVKDVIKFACLLDDPLCSYCRKQPRGMR